MDKIFIEGMAFFARHGVLAAEREVGQRFLVDLALYLDLSAAGAADDLTRTVDYLEVYRQVEKVVCSQSFHLLEALAEAIAAAVLGAFSVSRVDVRVRKPGAPLPGHFEAVGVEISRGREPCPEQ
ncbi:MAG: dihydroneopterin aldolase [Bacillota bacterium]|nr:dihydroneopterin aldolase [Thermoanaerobacteraceae bacterium]